MAIDGWTCFLWALLVLTLPLNWLVAAFCAATFHELCHFAAAKLLGGKLERIQVSMDGARMTLLGLSGTGELLCALAGPAGSFLLLPALHWWPQLALCALTQGVYNLLPIFPLDGGRVLRCVLALFLEDLWVDRLCRWAEQLTILGLAIVSIRIKWGFFPVILAFFTIGKLLMRKIPCKQRQLGVQ